LSFLGKGFPPSMVNRQTKQCAWCFTAACCCVACSILISGMILIPAGNAAKESASLLDVDNDFTYLGQSCQIRIVGHETDTTKEGSDGNQHVLCWDLYTYSFSKEGETITYLSKAERVFRSKSPGEDERSACFGDEAEPTFTVGQLAKCWEPKVLPVPEEYQCGNEACVKVFDPADDIADALAAAQGMIGGGIACFVVGCLCCYICVGGGSFVATRPEDQPCQQQPYQGTGSPPMTVGAPIQATSTPHIMGQSMAPVQAIPVQATVISAPVSINVMVPPGAMPGQTLQVKAPDGRMVQAAIPEGVGPGQSFQVQVQV